MHSEHVSLILTHQIIQYCEAKASATEDNSEYVEGT